jgi:hypothetical protein
MGKTQSWDNAWDVGAMSNYNTITSISESPKMEGLLYVGTDDGIIQVSEDGGSNWRKIETGSISGVPATAFINDIRADLFEANTVYAALDNHKYGDYKPYLIKSMDKGKSWRLITGDLPDKLLVWRLVQDHVKKDLLFTATEFGIYFTIDGGTKWIKLTGGVPTMSFRDITIQRREHDLVGASFGRGFFILDDISPLREINLDALQQEALLFDTRKAFWYNEIGGLYGQGHSEYTADNPPYGATFTYYLKDEIKSLKDMRKEKEKELSKQNKSISFPGWEALEKETRQDVPGIYLTIKDKEGKIVNQIKGSNAKGINRVAWDLSLASKDVVRLETARREDILTGENRFRATPGTYSVTLSRLIDGQLTELAGPKEFEVVPLKEGAIKGASYDEMIAFRQRFNTYQQEMSLVRMELSKGIQKVSALEQALSRAELQPAALIDQLYKTRENLSLIDREVNGYESKNEVGERNELSPRSGLSMGYSALNTTYGPTANHIKAFERSVKQLATVKANLAGIINDVIPGLEKAVAETGAPMIEGQGLKN